MERRVKVDPNGRQHSPATEPGRTHPGAESTAAFVNPFEGAVGPEEAQEYQGVRPSYPAAAYAAVLAAPRRAVQDAVDIGAGTGQFTRGLVERGLRTIAVEPSDSMRTVLASQPWASSVTIVNGTAEHTGLFQNCADVVIWAQCSHWLDIPRAAQEAARILRAEGALAVVANQLAVEIPWVHRLSRIMRSGDVVRRDRTPDLGPLFGTPRVSEVPWQQYLTVDECLALARTRSSYLAASPARREKMQENLRWYLLDHLGFDPHRSFPLPYVTYVWTAIRR